MKLQKAKIVFVSLILSHFALPVQAQVQDPIGIWRPDVIEEFNVQGKQCEFRSAMRKLWEDHITWTRVYIISAIGNLGDTNFAAQRLLKNQKDLGNAIAPFYGAPAGNQLTKLLREHILLAGEIVAALKAGNSDAAKAAIKKWYANADDIATFLNKANPDNWPLPEMKKMMRDHLDLTTKEVMARLKKRWKADIAAYDMVHTQALMMADMLALGIIKQFPTKF